MISLRLAHLYPRRMNIYGDRGNIITLVRRAEWRGMKITVDMIEVGDRVALKKYNLFFFGGGQDREQYRVADDLKGRADELKAAAREGAALLAVCGGYQLLGHYYQPNDGDQLAGIGLFDAQTEAGTKRLIGNVVARSSTPGLKSLPLVGFENHSGLTFLNKGATPLAQVEAGFGNNGCDGTEGCIHDHAVGTYLHGSLLPKNPHLADWLLTAALRHAGVAIKLKPLQSAFEESANASVVKRLQRR